MGRAAGLSDLSGAPPPNCVWCRQVARVQAQVLEAVRARHPDRPDRETALHVDLLDVTALYQLCEQLQLPGCQLAIVVCAGHRDAALVRALWTALLRSELAAAGAAAEAAAPAVTELARQYVSQPAYFPLETVVSVLEAEACRRGGQQPGWPAVALADAGVPLPQLLSVYQVRPPDALGTACWLSDSGYI